MNPLAFFRSLFGILVFPVWTIAMCLLVLLSYYLRGDRVWVDVVSQWWALVTLKLFGVKVLAKGRENIPQGSCLFAFSHSSFLDIFALEHLVRGIRFGAKAELFRIPIFAQTMKVAGILPIARNNRDQVMRLYEQSVARAKAGEQFALAPEGKRSQEAGKLLPFKSGPFVFAIQAQIPVVPVLIRGADRLWPKGKLVPNSKSWSSKLEVEFLPAIPTSNLELKERTLLAEQVRQRMLDSMAAQ